MSDENKTETKSTHPLFAFRNKAKDFIKGVFTPTPPPPTEYKIVRGGARSVDAEMTTLALEGWRFLATTSDGILMGRNHSLVVEIDGEVNVRERSYNTSSPYNYHHHEHEHKAPKSPRKSNPDKEEYTVFIPEYGDGQFPIESKDEEILHQGHCFPIDIVKKANPNEDIVKPQVKIQLEEETAN